MATRNKDLNAIYNASDILLLPSRHNFGNVVEALACGCAVLTSEETEQVMIW